VRKLFRDVARTIHPDLARDELTRDRRHSLMIEANRAYALGDEEQLRWILQAWERSPEAVQGSDSRGDAPAAGPPDGGNREQLGVLTSDLAELTDTPVWKLKAMVDQAAAKGKDLVRETVTRLKRDIMAAANRLDAMRPPTDRDRQLEGALPHAQDEVSGALPRARDEIPADAHATGSRETPRSQSGGSANRRAPAADARRMAKEHPTGCPRRRPPPPTSLPSPRRMRRVRR
jgi:hypothetical protein